ncbi:host attachment protein [Hyphomicrobium facile]|uniref:Protein required for attachment to host cells n=1 Tax=Hyphomicrobium facile TaxID=51670 RepID=A0A1I7N697_9HYPH|nr:host attachment protein [Hyphomicrobium facile]SFV30076.1 Protein required for attachment to host cells [Hyphomicrobium facile]
MKPTRTWILIADGAHARMVEALGKGHGLHEVAGTETRLHIPPSHLLGKAEPGRVHESVGYTRHAIEPKSDPHDSLEVQFADQLADHLRQYVEINAFDRLVIVAPPTMLGYLRKRLVTDVTSKVIAEVDKDLTKVPNDDVASHLENVVYL